MGRKVEVFLLDRTNFSPSFFFPPFPIYQNDYFLLGRVNKSINPAPFFLLGRTNFSRLLSSSENKVNKTSKFSISVVLSH